MPPFISVFLTFFFQIIMIILAFFGLKTSIKQVVVSFILYCVLVFLIKIVLNIDFITKIEETEPGDFYSVRSHTKKEIIGFNLIFLVSLNFILYQLLSLFKN